jgi:hypothetical protein
MWTPIRLMRRAREDALELTPRHLAEEAGDRGLGRTTIEGRAVMWRSLRRPVLWMIGLNVACWTIGQILTRRLSQGDEQSDEFPVATVWGAGSSKAALSGYEPVP